MEKLKAVIFDGPQIRELGKDSMFDDALSAAELSAWRSLKSVITNFLGNNRSAEYEKEVDELLKNFSKIKGSYVSQNALSTVPLRLFPSELWRPEEQGQRFHQVIRVMEERCQGRWDVNFLADYCWCLTRDVVATQHMRKSLKRSFIND